VLRDIEGRLRGTEVALQGALQRPGFYSAISAATTTASQRVAGYGVSPVFTLATLPGAIWPLKLCVS